MKILIIEDEERSFMRLRRLLLQIDETFEIEGPITSVGETASMLRNDYDIIFADIRLDYCHSSIILFLPMSALLVQIYDNYLIKPSFSRHFFQSPLFRSYPLPFRDKSVSLQQV